MTDKHATGTRKDKYTHVYSMYTFCMYVKASICYTVYRIHSELYTYRCNYIVIINVNRK